MDEIGKETAMAEDEVYHYGIKRRSGRYPWGSGEDPYQGESWYGRVQQMRDSGMSDNEIAKAMGMTTTQFRNRRTVEVNAIRAAQQSQAYNLKKKGWSTSAIGREMGLPESTVRSLLDPSRRARTTMATKIADSLEKTIGKDGAVDIGRGVELYLGTSQDKLKAATEILRQKGYEVRNLYIEQQGTGKKTTVKVLAAPGVTSRQLYLEPDRIKQLAKSIDDVGGHSGNLGIDPPVAVSDKRVKVRYAEEGGKDMDGVMQIRPGAADLQLGQARYAQVRISVNGTHYLKGMAMYGDPKDFPDGVDIIFNTNKHKGTPKMDVFKPVKDDPDNPFGATVRQFKYIDPKTGKMKQSAINIVNEEGKWDTWSKNLASQMLSKQDVSLAKRQLGLAYDRMRMEYDEIMSLTNPVVKRKLLQQFADECDSAAVHMRGAAMPRQRSQVILPLTTIGDNEIYAPNFHNGERVVLIRYPHGGKFEIPELKVNNRNKEGKKFLGGAKDAVGINSKVAERLSGADFDGDTVLVIPNNRGEIKTRDALKGLKDFDPKEAYPGYEGMKPMTKKQKQTEMGKVSNLITDMTIKGAPWDEIERAVRHSMVVIDAEKHKLNWKQSEIDNGIPALKKKWQGRTNAGASTLISRATSDTRVDERKLRSAKKGGSIDPATGKKVYEETGATYQRPVRNKNGDIVGTETVRKKTRSTKMAETDDAFTLSSGTPMETTYAQFANSLKALANQSRKSYLNTPTFKQDPQARKKYSTEVSSLKAKLNTALKNAPLERQAQLIAGQIYRAKAESNNDMEADERKRLKSQALNEARERVGAKKQQVNISDKEWEAIQNRAVSSSMLAQILDNADPTQVRELATPHKEKKVPSYVLSRARSLLNAGYTYDEVADALGISTSTLTRNL